MRQSVRKGTDKFPVEHRRGKLRAGGSKGGYSGESKRFIPMKTSIVVAAVIVLWLLCAGYWWRQKPAALGAEDYLLVGDVANGSEERDFDGALREALRVALAQSPTLNLTSDEKLRTVVQNAGKSDGEPLTEAMVGTFCEREGAKAYLTGQLTRAGQGYEIKLEVKSCGDGSRLAREIEQAAHTNLVIHYLGVAAVRLREKLGENAETVKKFDVPLERATNPIPAALKAYDEARKAIREKGDLEAVPHFKKAIELDARLALARSGLAVSYYNLNQMAQAGDEIRQAYEAGDRQTLRERLNITTLYYDLGVGDIEKAIEGYKEYIRTYPRDDVAMGNLSSEYFVTGNYEEAVKYAREALKIDPHSSAWYENLSTALLALSRVDEAEAVLREAFARNLDDGAALQYVFPRFH